MSVAVPHVGAGRRPVLPSSLHSLKVPVSGGGAQQVRSGAGREVACVPGRFPDGGVLRKVAVSGQRLSSFTDAQQRWAADETSGVLRRLREERGARILITSMGLGFELWAAEEARSLGYSVWAYAPFPQQADGWPMRWRERWENVLGNSACEVYASGRFDVGAYAVCDELMAADCDVMVSAVTAGPGRLTALRSLRAASGAGKVAFVVDAGCRRSGVVGTDWLDGPRSRGGDSRGGSRHDRARG